ncbi:MAG TPA: IPT/TIG domain-containing protein [Kofleriaceae bacterium]
MIATVLAGCTEAEPTSVTNVGSLDNPGLIHAAGGPLGQKADGTGQARQPALTYNGGPMLQAPELHAVFWGTAVAPDTQSAVTSWFGDLAQSTVVPMLGQYDTASPAQFITQMHFAGAIMDVDAPVQTTISDQDIQVELTRMIDAGTAPANDGNQLYVMYMPPGATVTTPFGNSCVAFCGYHGSFYRNGTNAFYAVIPDMTVDPCKSACAYDPTPLNDVYMASSHEVTEATTDAAVGAISTGGPSYAWIDPLTGNEIGDICAGLSFTTAAGLMEQQEWSNAAQGCVGASPASQSAISVAPGQVTAPASGTVTLQLTATGTAAQSLGTFSLPAGVTAAIDPTQISGGQTATITLTSASTVASQGEIGVYSVDANSTIHLSYVQLTVQGPAPTLTGVAAASGPAAGAQSVTVTGTNLAAIRSVTFGGVAASAIAPSADGMSVTVTTPGHAAGVVLVQAVSADGQTASLGNAYTYEASPAPTLAAASATIGPSRGGRTIALTGTGFGSATVTFGGVAAAITAATATELDVIEPAHPAGAADIVVTNGDGQSATLAAGYTFADLAPPVLERLTTATGPAAGGQYITIELGDVVGVTPTVQFGGVAATVVSTGPTFISVKTPAHDAGAVDVSVTDSGQTATLPGAFTFQ